MKCSELSSIAEGTGAVGGAAAPCQLAQGWPGAKPNQERQRHALGALGRGGLEQG
jgi:hypothetical protein